ncbi:MAG: sulfotransferase, partial [Planctomycetaceae bacterium]|nr:sulfotransferase [Planctomycetaceae bacterium]
IGTALDMKHGIDAVIFVDGLYFRGQRSRIPQSIRRAGVPTVLIATDDPYESLANTDALYAYRFTNEIRSASDGVRYLPTATLPMPDFPPDDRHEYDVCFVGTVFEDRYPLLKAVSDYCETQQYRMLIAGKLTQGDDDFRDRMFTRVLHGTVDSAQKLELYTRSRTVLNVFRQSEHPADSPSPRIFEVTGLGQAALISGTERAEVTRIFGDTVLQFTDAETACAALNAALADEEQRRRRVREARVITDSEHLYRHRVQTLVGEVRAAESECGSTTVGQEKTAWIIGCGRTGSTWLSELLAEVPGIRRWHEPYFGRFFRHVHDRPEESDRAASFFSRQHDHVWLEGLRDLFFRMVRERYPQFGRHALVVKEVNTPEIYPWLNRVFPSGRLILLVRDPFDTLDSYLDLQQPGSWNEQFGDSAQPLSEANVVRTAEHIRASMWSAWEAFQTFPADRRLEVRYESLLADAANVIQDCGRIVGTDVSADAAAKAVSKHDFSNYTETGEGRFRRKGQAGTWKESRWFTPEVLQIAERILGPLRSRLGYRDEERLTNSF